MSFSALPNTGPVVALTQSAGCGPLNDSARFVGLSTPEPVSGEPISPEQIHWLPKRRNPLVAFVLALFQRVSSAS